MELKPILLEKKESVAWITLNRPEVRNAQNDALRSELLWALENIRDDDEVRVIVITGAGDKAFSAGADISEFPKRMPADILKTKATKRAVDLQIPRRPFDERFGLRTRPLRHLLWHGRPEGRVQGIPGKEETCV